MGARRAKPPQHEAHQVWGPKGETPEARSTRITKHPKRPQHEAVGFRKVRNESRGGT